MARGYFITFEGGEGAGKSTQVEALAQRLAPTGREIVKTREPGGSPGAEAIRDMLVTGQTERWSARTEALLMNAARSDHVEHVIGPALARGAVVLCDRFADSTRAYQGAGGGVGPEWIMQLETQVVGNLKPDLTLILDLPPEVGLRRAAGRGHSEDRFEGKSPTFHARLRAHFLMIAAAEPNRCHVIDATLSPDQVQAEIWAAVRLRLNLR